jgi:hypothetical protein
LESIIKVDTNSYMLMCVADLRIIYWYLTGHLIMLGRADMLTSLMIIKG